MKSISEQLIKEWKANFPHSRVTIKIMAKQHAQTCQTILDFSYHNSVTEWCESEIDKLKKGKLI